MTILVVQDRRTGLGYPGAVLFSGNITAKALTDWIKATKSIVQKRAFTLSRGKLSRNYENLFLNC